MAIPVTSPLEQKAIDVNRTGYKYPGSDYTMPDPSSTDLYSFTSPSRKQMPQAIEDAYTEQIKQVKRGMPEQFRTALQPYFKRGIGESNLAVQNVGNVGINLANIIGNLETMKKIKPLEAQANYEDMMRLNAIAKLQEETRRGEKQEGYTEQQRARDDLLSGQTGSALMNILTGSGALSKAIWGGSTDPMSAMMAKLGLPVAATQKGYAQQAFDKIKNLLTTGSTGGEAGFLSEPIAGYVNPKTGLLESSGIPTEDYAPNDPFFRPTDQTMTAPEYNQYIEEILGEGGATLGEGDIATTSAGDAFFANQMQQFTPEAITEQWNLDPYGTNTPAINQGFDTNPFDMYGTDTSDIGQWFDTDPVDMYGTNTPGGNLWDFKQASIDAGKGSLEAQAIKTGSESILDKVPEVLKTMISTPAKALSTTMETVSGIKKDVGNAISAGLDTVTGGAFSSIKKVISDATSAASDLTGNIVSPSTVASLALTAATGGLKNIAKNPMQFAGQKILASSLPSLKTTVGALAKGTLPDIAWTADAALKAATTSAAGQAAGTAAYNAAIANGASVKVALAAKSNAIAATAAPSVIAASMVAIPMILSEIGSMEKKKSRAKAEIEEKRNLAGSAQHNFLPGGLHMVGRKTDNPVIIEASSNIQLLDEATGISKSFIENPNVSIMDGPSLTERGQNYAKSANINYQNPDPDIQNFSQKIMGKYGVYTSFIPGLDIILKAGLQGKMTRDNTELEASKVINSYMNQHPEIRQIYGGLKDIANIEHQEADEIDTVQDQIMAMREQLNKMKAKLPYELTKAPMFKPYIFEVEQIEDEQA